MGLAILPVCSSNSRLQQGVAQRELESAAPLCWSSRFTAGVDNWYADTLEERAGSKFQFINGIITENGRKATFP